MRFDCFSEQETDIKYTKISEFSDDITLFSSCLDNVKVRARIREPPSAKGSPQRKENEPHFRHEFLDVKPSKFAKRATGRA